MLLLEKNTLFNSLAGVVVFVTNVSKSQLYVAFCEIDFSLNIYERR